MYLSQYGDLSRKMTRIKAAHGSKALAHFINNNICELCGEDRVACLEIHHTHGKKREVFKTLCSNCHVLEHTTKKYKKLTFKIAVSAVKKSTKKALKKIEIYKTVIELIKK